MQILGSTQRSMLGNPAPIQIIFPFCEWASFESELMSPKNFHPYAIPKYLKTWLVIGREGESLTIDTFSTSTSYTSGDPITFWDYRYYACWRWWMPRDTPNGSLKATELNLQSSFWSDCLDYHCNLFIHNNTNFCLFLCLFVCIVWMDGWMGKSSNPAFIEQTMVD